MTIGFILLFFAATCSSSVSDEQKEITGTIEEQGITSYQYGTHTLTTPDQFYALTSDAVDLNEYLDQEVTVVAEKVSGYPVDGGPEYFRVLKIK